MFDSSLCTNTSDCLRRPLPPFLSLGCRVDPKANDTDNQKTGKSDGKPDNETVVIKGMIARGVLWTLSCLCRRRSGWIPAGYRVTKCFWRAGREARGVAGLPLDIPGIVHLDGIVVVCSRRYEMSCYGFGEGGGACLGN